MSNLKTQVSKLDHPIELRLYVGALIPKDTTMVSKTPCRYTQESHEKIISLDKKEHKATIYLYHPNLLTPQLNHRNATTFPHP